VRAAGVTHWGGPEVLQVVDLPDPQAGTGEVRIRVHDAAVNPTDTQLRGGARAERLKDVPPPHVPGMDAAGVLDQIGEGTETDLRLGEQVMAIVLPLGSRGAYAEEVVVPAESVVRVPNGASLAEAATLPMNGLTARCALDALALEPGGTLAVSGAAGAVGGYTVQLAKAEGLRVIADAAPADEALVRGLGADVVVRRGDAFATGVRAVVPAGADALVDAALLDERAAEAVRDGGAVATLRGYDGAGAAGRGIVFHPVYVRTYARERERLDRLRAQAEEGIVTLRVARVLPLERAAEAHRLLEAGGIRGRIVLEM
jgi:NADPH:quinone reductase-like Zn-dependent oxidoreductase